MDKKCYTPQRKGRIYIGSPTLEKLLSSCYNVKDAASISGIEYSNFVKACKLQQDVRLSTYQRCASGLGMDVLIIHLPCGHIDSISPPKAYRENRYHIIDEEDLGMILMKFLHGGNLINLYSLKSFEPLLEEQKDNSLVRQILSSLIILCQELLKEDGNE